MSTFNSSVTIKITDQGASTTTVASGSFVFATYSNGTNNEIYNRLFQQLATVPTTFTVGGTTYTLLAWVQFGNSPA